MERKKIRYDQSSSLSKLLMLWNIEFIKSLRREPPTFETLPEIPEDYAFESSYEKIRVYWEEESYKAKPSLLKVLIKAVGFEYLKCSILRGYLYVSNILQALLLYQIVLYLREDSAELWEGVLLGFLFILNHFITLLLTNRGCYLIMMLSGKLKCWVLMLLSEKLMKTSSIELSKIAPKVLDLVGNDVELFEMLIATGNLSCLPIILPLCIYILWEYVGPLSGIIGVVLIFSQFVLTTYLGKIASRIRSVLAKVSDSRIKMISNLIEGIKVIKLYTWELPILSMIYSERTKEIHYFMKMSWIQIVGKVLNLGMTGTAVFVTLLIYIHQGNELKPEIAFGVMSVLTVLNTAINYFCAIGIRVLFLFFASCKRITEVLCAENHLPQESKTDKGIAAENCTFAWSQNHRGLSQINFDICPGELLVVTGPVGSGKSTLLLGLLRELLLVEGNLDISGFVAYCPDTPWIVPASLKENIIMGRTYNEELYSFALKQSSLLKDLETIHDSTIIGDKGVTLSGGQKARICLARAIYSDADILILDDPLSAVDAEVCQELIHSVLQLKSFGKCIVLSTHQVHALPYADKVLVLNENQQMYCGNTQDMQLDLYSMIENVKNLEEEQNSKEGVKSSVIASEERAEGSTPLKIYWDYLMLGFQNKCWIFACLFILAISQVAILSTYYFIAILSESKDQDNSDYIIAAVCILIAGYFFSLLRFILLYTGIVASNKHLHNASIKGITETHSTFFDKNPTGRIINRFTKDTIILDEILLHYIVEFAHNSFMLLGNFLLITIISPVSLIALLILFILVFVAIKYIAPLTQDMRKLELISRSPILIAFTEIIGGIVSIRSLSLQATFIGKVRDLVYDCMRSFASYHSLLRHLQIIIDSGAFTISSVNVISLIATKGLVSPELAGLTLALVISSAGFSNYWSKTLVELDNSMASPQRLFEYKDLPPEGEHKSTEAFLVREGRIKFEQVQMRYQEHLPLALNDLSFEISPKNKVGIVGRTGAGKSSVLQVLFRLVNPCQGSVFIDGQDYMRAGVHDLRGQMSVIPQFPFLFKGTIRENLDPLSEFSEDLISRTLKLVNLEQFCHCLNDPIKTSEVSSGQKQLICLGRAILKKCKILMMDEATANVDHNTDTCMQKQVRECFGESTVLVVAHRLRTVIDTDLVMVIEHGRCAEIGHPAELASRTDSLFRGLIEHTGEQESKHLLSSLNIE